MIHFNAATSSNRILQEKFLLINFTEETPFCRARRRRGSKDECSVLPVLPSRLTEPIITRLHRTEEVRGYYRSRDYITTDLHNVPGPDKKGG